MQQSSAWNRSSVAAQWILPPPPCFELSKQSSMGHLEHGFTYRNPCLEQAWCSPKPQISWQGQWNLHVDVLFCAVCCVNLCPAVFAVNYDICRSCTWYITGIQAVKQLVGWVPVLPAIEIWSQYMLVVSWFLAFTPALFQWLQQLDNCEHWNHHHMWERQVAGCDWFLNLDPSLIFL